MIDKPQFVVTKLGTTPLALQNATFHICTKGKLRFNIVDSKANAC